MCANLADRLRYLQEDPAYESSLLAVYRSLSDIASEVPTWEIQEGLHRLLKPFCQRGHQSLLPKKAPFIVIEGIDSSGKSFHLAAIAEAVEKKGFPVRTLLFPNATTKLGRFLKMCLREGKQMDLWTQHVLFSLHRWEMNEWITQSLEQGEAVVCERYSWSGMAYSIAYSEPGVELGQLMSTDLGILLPDVVVFMDVKPDKVTRIGVSPLFDDRSFQKALYDAYQKKEIWAGVRLLRHRLSPNKWDSSKRLIQCLLPLIPNQG